MTVIMLTRVHEYVVDRATRTAKIVKTSPIRRWNSEEHPPVLYQNGQFYTDGGVPMAMEDVPEYIRRDVALRPVRPADEARTADVLRFCPICAEAGKDVALPQAELEAHLVEHIRGIQTTEPEESAPEPNQKFTPVNRRHGPKREDGENG